MISVAQQLQADIYKDKYLQQGESFEEGMYRLAGALADDEEHRVQLKDIFLSRRFLPAGRVQCAIGAVRRTTPYNCYVSGTIQDSMNDIMDKAKEAAMTMRMGGGIGYNFSTLRPSGDIIKSLDSISSGPLSFMEIFNSTCGVISSAGHRRGAQMGVLNVNHPDILKFIHAKNNSTSLTNFNISVGITDDFMKAVKEGGGYDLTFGGRTYQTVDANALWDSIMRMTWDYAEPGVLFLDTINKKNNLWYCEDIQATNPCGEQPLPPYGACLLGSFNLTAYLLQGEDNWGFDFEGFANDVEAATRAMDNVIDQALYPLPQQKEEALNKRRMGLGVTGVANTLERLGSTYGDEKFTKGMETILAMLNEVAYSTSVDVGKLKGIFPLSQPKITQSGFMQSGALPSELVKKIEKFGLRNSHLTSIAPTGTISLAAGNISSGIEPVFALEQDRVVRRESGTIQTYQGLKDFGADVLGIEGKTTEELNEMDHLSVLISASRYVDSACSKTCNIGDDVKYNDFKEIYNTAWENGASGCTTFRPSGKRFGILSKSSTDDTSGKTVPVSEGTTGSTPIEEGAACYIDPKTGERSCGD